MTLWDWLRSCPHCTGIGHRTFEVTRRRAAKLGIARRYQSPGKTKDHVLVGALCKPCGGSGTARLPMMATKAKSLATAILLRLAGSLGIGPKVAA